MFSIVGWSLSKHGYSHTPKKEHGECFEGKRPVGRPRGRKENIVWRNAVDIEQEGGSKEERNLERINWRGRGPKMFRSIIGEGEDENNNNNNKKKKKKKKKKKMMMMMMMLMMMIQDHLSESL